jgi:hypothetical protein
MQRLLISGILLLAATITALPQTTHIHTDTVYGCVGDTLVVHVKTTAFTGVGSMTLYLHYNPLELRYDTCKSLNPLLPGMLVNHYLVPQPTVGFSWFTTTMTPSNIGDGTIASLRFVMLTDSAWLYFSPQCEITDPFGAPLQAILAAHPVKRYSIPINQHPGDAITVVYGNASFTVVPDQAAVSLQWQVSEDLIGWSDLHDDTHHSGVNTTQLSIYGVPDSLFGNAYRCRLAQGNCVDYSLHARLIKDTTSGTGLTMSISSEILPYPNPFNHHLVFPVGGENTKNATFALYDMSGRLVVSKSITPLQNNANETVIQLDEIQSGTYIAVVHFTGSDGLKQKQKHIIIKK